MTILDEIIAYKRELVAKLINDNPLSEIEKLEHYNRKPISLRERFNNSDKPGIIAEIKRRSPSKGDLRPNLVVPDLASEYERNGAAAISVLTDTKYFGGDLSDLAKARTTVNCPLLCKDFIVSEYQIHSAKAHGADIILLIAAAISAEEIKTFAKLAQELGMEVLLEVHTEEEISNSPTQCADHVGVNCRNLHDFSVDVQRFYNLAEKLPKDSSLIAESGITSKEVISDLLKAGYRGFLIGEHFMKSESPGEGLRALLA